MLLSICMPTYNYGSFIGEAIDSILSQIQDEVEVIVLDGGSTDKTKDVVALRLQKDARLKYHEQSFRGGIDRDIEKVVSLASGRYCWLFSADDVMLPGAITKVLQALESNLDIYVCEHALCDLQMNIISRYPIFSASEVKRIFDFGVETQKSEYFRNALNSEAFFSFLSAPIFKKTIWDEAEVPDSFRGTCWIVAAHLLSAFSKDIKISYMAETLLHKREGNDSFSNGSLVNRCKIGIENFHFVINSIFGSATPEARSIKKVLQKDIPYRVLIAAKLRAARFPETENGLVLNKLVMMHYSDSGIIGRIKIFIFKVLPISLLDCVRVVVGSVRGVGK